MKGASKVPIKAVKLHNMASDPDQDLPNASHKLSQNFLLLLEPAGATNVRFKASLNGKTQRWSAGTRSGCTFNSRTSRTNRRHFRRQLTAKKMLKTMKTRLRQALIWAMVHARGETGQKIKTALDTRHLA